MTKRIPLTQGYFTVVDDEDYQYYSQFKWRAENAHRADKFPVYATRGVRHQKNKTERQCLHRLIANARANQMVDHIDGDSLNNTRENLRITDSAGNAKNRRKRTTATSSQYLGVCWSKSIGKWQAQMVVGGKVSHIGVFANEEEAARARDAYVRSLDDEFYVLNFPQELS